MSEQVGSRILSPDQSYDIQMIIEDLDYTNDLIGVQIVSSILTAYQIISIDLVLDQQDILFKRLYGKDPISLTIRYMGRSGASKSNEIEKITFDLMQVSDISVVRLAGPNMTGKHRELSKVSILTIPRKPFVTMMSMVNDLFYGVTPSAILSQLIQSSGANVNFDANNLNKFTVEQVLIPPMTLYKAIEYIDTNFGIYEGGVCNYGFCNYDNTVNIFNLSKKINNSVAFTVHQVAVGGDNSDVFKNPYDGKNFVTYHNLDSEYHGNTKICNTPKNITYSIKPTDMFYQLIKLNFYDICQKNGVYTGNSPEIYHDSILDSRELFHTGYTGNDLSSAFAVSNIARYTFDFSNLTIYLDRNIQISNMLRVGEAVRLETKTVEYVELAGNYILKASEITFNKETMNWMPSVVLKLNRTNKTIS